MFGISDMVVVFIVAVAGAVLLKSMKSPSSTTTRRSSIPIVAFISGPLLTTGFFLVDAYCISPTHYVHPDDFAGTAAAAVVIGLVAGTIGAATFWIAER